MIERLRLQEFKSHRDTEIKLGRFTVLVGPNGAGKTSVLQALDVMAWLNPDVPQHPLDWPGAGLNLLIELDGQWVDKGNELKAWKSKLSASPGPNRAATFQFWPDRNEQTVSSSPREMDFWQRTVLAHLDPNRIATPSYTAQTTPQVSADGEHVADVIADMRLSDLAREQELLASLRKVVPEIRGIRVRRTRVQRTVTRYITVEENEPVPIQGAETHMGYELRFDTTGGEDLPAQAMSEGTLVALGILTILWSPTRPRLLLLDGLERALHPKAQWSLVDQLRRMLDMSPDLQIVATTHSPDLVNRLSAEEVVVMSLDSEGVSRARPLTECPRKDMLEVLQSGELWSALDETWVTEEKP